MKKITQKECLNVFNKTPFPRSGSELMFILRFMFKLNDLAKKRGYRLFHWTDYMIQDNFKDIAIGYIVSNIEVLSKEVIKCQN